MSMRRFQRLSGYRAVPLLLWLACRPSLGAEPSPRPSLRPPDRLGVCTPALSQAATRFPDGAGHKLLVVDFSAGEAAAQELGHERAWSLSRELPQLLQRAGERLDAASRLQPNELRLRYVPCTVSSEEQAHAIGQAWGADSLLWGAVPAGDAGQPAQLALTLTAVRFEGEPQRVAGARRYEPLGVPDVSFLPAPANSFEALVPPLLAVHAYRQQRYRLVSAALASLVTAPPSAAGPPGLLALLGHSLVRSGQGEAGLEVLRRARSRCEAGDTSCQALAEAQLAWALAQRSESKQALAQAEQAVATAQKSSSRLLEVALTNLEGELLHQLSKPRAGDERYQRALRLATEQADVPGQLQALISLSLAASARGLDSGLSWASQALALASQHGNPLWLSRARLYAGMAQAWAGDVEAARREYQAALDWLGSHGDLAGQQRVLRLLGSLSGPEREGSPGGDELEKSARLAQQMGDLAGEARVRIVEAKLAPLRRDFRRASLALAQAQDLWRRLGSKSGQVEALIVQSIVSAAENQPAKASASLEQAQGLAEQADETSLRAWVLRERSRLQVADKQLPQALATCEEARQLMQSIDEVQGVVEGLQCAARVQEARAERELARTLYEQAFTTARAGGAARVAEQLWPSLVRLQDPQTDAATRIAYFDRLHFGEVSPEVLPWAALQPTQAASNPAPQLPASLKAELSCGSLSLRYRLCVKPDGHVDHVMAMQSLPAADEPIRKTLRSWRFAPRGQAACSLLDLRFALEAEASYCAQRRKEWQFLSPQLVDAVRTAGGAALPWPLQPALAAGQVRTAAYRLCYDATGAVAQAIAVRGLERGDSLILPKLREQRIQPLGIPICTYQFMTFRGPGPENPASGARILPAVQIRKEALSCPDPRLPDPVKARLRGQVVTASYKLCIAEDGSIGRAEILRGITGADDVILSVVAHWRYQPRPVPNCFIQNFEYHISE